MKHRNPMTFLTETNRNQPTKKVRRTSLMVVAFGLAVLGFFPAFAVLFILGGTSFWSVTRSELVMFVIVPVAAELTGIAGSFFGKPWGYAITVATPVIYIVLVSAVFFSPP